MTYIIIILIETSFVYILMEEALTTEACVGVQVDLDAGMGKQVF